MIRAVFLGLAMVLVAAWLALEAAGGRAAASVVAGGAASPEQVLLGVAYVAVHLAAVVGAVPLAVAGLAAGAGRRGRAGGAARG